MSEDDVASYISERGAELLGQQTAEALSLSAPGRSAQELAQALPGLVGKCAGLCHFFGIQQQGHNQNRGQKFLLVAAPLPEALPQGARIICLCAALPKEEALDI